MPDRFPPKTSTQPPCAACDPGASRRDFLRDVVSLIGSAGALGAVPSSSFGLTFELTAALRVVGGEAVYPLPTQDGATIDRDHEVILVRYQNRVYAFGLSCPHQRTALRWVEEEKRFRCPKHKSTFDQTGTFLSGRATRAMDRYALRRDGDKVVVDLSALYQEDKDRERWGQAVMQL